jgi:hypothetical protein
MYQFTKDQLKKYREIVSDHAKGKGLSDIINKLLRNKKYQLGGKTYKKTPRGFDPEYKYSELLLHSGLYVFYESKNFNELTQNDPVIFSYKIFNEMLPLHRWCVENLI